MDDNIKARAQMLARMRFNYVFEKAWSSIVEERFPLVDMWLCTSSHGTLALQAHLRANGM